jgi:hypothetical protein
MLSQKLKVTAKRQAGNTTAGEQLMELSNLNSATTDFVGDKTSAKLANLYHSMRAARGMKTRHVFLISSRGIMI